MRKYKKIVIASILVFAVSLLGKIGILVSADALTIQLGIRVLNRLSSISNIVLALSSIASLASGGLMTTSRLKEYKQEAIVDMKENTPILGMKGSLDPRQIKNQLNETLEPWCEYSYKLTNGSIMNNTFEKLLKQFDEMDSHQLRLHKLLENNGATALGDTEDILNNVEQNICKRVRNLINIVSIYDVNGEHLNSVLDESNKCYKENKSLLKSAQEFMLAVANYLNTQNSDVNMDELNLYKEALLNEINKK